MPLTAAQKLKLLFELDPIQSLYLSLAYRGGPNQKPGRLLTIRIHRRTRLKRGRGAIIASGGILELGSVIAGGPRFESFVGLGDDASLIAHGHFRINTGCYILVGRGAALELGSGYINNNVLINCRAGVTIGHQVAIANDVMIRDSDAHHLLPADRPATQPIRIGNHVWIGMRP
jgi:hypothetical protein